MTMSRRIPIAERFVPIWLFRLLVLSRKRLLPERPASLWGIRAPLLSMKNSKQATHPFGPSGMRCRFVTVCRARKR